MAKDIKFQGDARGALKRGIDILAEAVSMTLGPKGRAVVVEKAYGTPMVTLDGVTVAKEIKLKDPFENLGANLVKQAADKTNDKVGDGTTTSIVLAKALIDESERYIVDGGINVIKLADCLKNIAKEVCLELDKHSEKVETPERLEEVATLSSKDPAIGKLIAEVMDKAGKNGVVTVDDSNSVENFYEMVEGLSFDKGYLSQYMVTNQDKMEAVIEQPYILVTDKKISSVNDLLPLLEKIMATGRKELVIIAEDIETEPLAMLVVNKMRGTLATLAIKAPGFGDNKKELLQDIAIVTGATFISDDLGKKLEAVEIADLGEAAKVVSTRDTTTIVGGTGDQDEINKRVESIKAQGEKLEPGYEKEKLNERVGKIAGGVTVIKIGAPTESAQKELKQRVEDAVAATKAAMEEGIVPGGGIALFNASLTLIKVKEAEGETLSDDEVARELMIAATQAPLMQIVINSGEGEKYQEIALELKNLKTLRSGAEWLGYNANTNSIGDLKKSGIIDPLKVTKTALNNAVSVAANFLTIGAAIVNEPKKDEESGALPPGFGGM